MTTGLTYLTKLIPNIACIAVLYRYPEVWKTSKLYMKKPILILFLLVCYTTLGWIIYQNMKNYPPVLLVIVAFVLIATVCYIFYRDKKRSSVYDNVLSEEDMRF